MTVTESTWKCGHPRTPENTINCGKGDRRCRECRKYAAQRRVLAPRPSAYDSEGKRIWLSML